MRKKKKELQDGVIVSVNFNESTFQLWKKNSYGIVGAHTIQDVIPVDDDNRSEASFKSEGGGRYNSVGHTSYYLQINPESNLTNQTWFPGYNFCNKHNSQPYDRNNDSGSGETYHFHQQNILSPHYNHSSNKNLSHNNAQKNPQMVRKHNVVARTIVPRINNKILSPQKKSVRMDNSFKNISSNINKKKTNLLDLVKNDIIKIFENSGRKEKKVLDEVHDRVIKYIGTNNSLEVAQTYEDIARKIEHPRYQYNLLLKAAKLYVDVEEYLKAGTLYDRADLLLPKIFTIRRRRHGFKRKMHHDLCDMAARNYEKGHSYYSAARMYEEALNALHLFRNKGNDTWFLINKHNNKIKSMANNAIRNYKKSKSNDKVLELTEKIKSTDDNNYKNLVKSIEVKIQTAIKEKVNYFTEVHKENINIPEQAQAEFISLLTELAIVTSGPQIIIYTKKLLEIPLGDQHNIVKQLSKKGPLRTWKNKKYIKKRSVDTILKELQDQKVSLNNDVNFFSDENGSFRNRPNFKNNINIPLNTIDVKIQTTIKENVGCFIELHKKNINIPKQVQTNFISLLTELAIVVSDPAIIISAKESLKIPLGNRHSIVKRLTGIRLNTARKNRKNKRKRSANEILKDLQDQKISLNKCINFFSDKNGSFQNDSKNNIELIKEEIRKEKKALIKASKNNVEIESNIQNQFVRLISQVAFLCSDFSFIVDIRNDLEECLGDEHNIIHKLQNEMVLWQGGKIKVSSEYEIIQGLQTLEILKAIQGRKISLNNHINFFPNKNESFQNDYKNNIELIKEEIGRKTKALIKARKNETKIESNTQNQFVHLISQVAFLYSEFGFRFIVDIRDDLLEGFSENHNIIHKLEKEMESWDEVRGELSSEYEIIQGLQALRIPIFSSQSDQDENNLLM